MSTDAVQAVLDRLDGVKQTGDGQYAARCPGHDDRVQSLSVGQGDDGRALLHCHAGCDTDDLLAEIGLTKRDLFPKGTGPNGQERKRRTARRAVYQTFEAAVAAAERQTQGKHAGTWTYHRADGDEHFRVARFDLSDGKKTYRPFHRDAEGWVQADPPGLLSLYGLPRLPSADRLYLHEGEKCVEAAAKIGLASTTSAHGCNAPEKSDWTPMAGHQVVMLPDHDANGRTYTQTVAGILSRLDPPASVKIVTLPDLPDHGDIVDFIADRRSDAKDDAAIRAEIEALAEQAPGWEPGPPPAPRVLSRNEARRKLRDIFKLGRTVVRAGIDLCCELRDFHEDGGLEALGDGDSPLPMSYIASGLGVTKQRVHQLIEAGRSWRRCVNKVDADMAGDLTEAHMRPLAKLNPDQQIKALASALTVAREDHKAEQAQREAAGRKPTRLRLKQKHARQAVEAFLPQPEKSSTAEPDPLQALRARIAELIDLARKIGAPPGVETGLMAANKAVYEAQQTRGTLLEAAS